MRIGDCRGRLGLRLGLWGLLAVLCSSIGCKPTDGSETNWFGSCNGNEDCASGSSCLCGMCSVSCSVEDTCSDVSPNLRCSDGASSAYAAQCGGPAPLEQGICLMRCGSDSDCPNNRTCTDGACVSAPTGRYMEPLLLAETPPAPISGGTLAVLAGGQTAAVSDPDHDQVVLVDLAAPRITAIVPLLPGDEPGRLIEDASGQLHVALRRGSAVASIDAVTGKLLARRAVCQYPRGIAYDPASDLLHVACAGGELVSLPASGGKITRTLHVEDDLRDVVVYGSNLVISRFRSAEVLVLDASGVELWRSKPAGTFTGFGIGVRSFETAVAWRMIPAAGLGVLLVHHEVDHVEGTEQQLGESTETGVGNYGSGATDVTCATRLRAAVTLLDPSDQHRSPLSLALLPTVLPVDIAFRAEADEISVASAAARPPSATGLSSGRTFSIAEALVAARAPKTGWSPAAHPDPEQFCGTAAQAHAPGQTVALAYDGSGRLITQTREPSALVVGSVSVPLPGASRRDTGHELFHLPTDSGLACASCHPEGGDDGHTWNLVGSTLRRTQSLIGGVAGSEPLHWDGELKDVHALLPEVMAVNMRGPKLQYNQIEAVSRFINAIPPWLPRPVEDSAAVERGRALFESASVGCAACHGGPRFTNNETVDVGTGRPFQVPSLLGVSRRAPLMHDGCANTLRDRFASCGGGDSHGVVSQLGETQLDDLVTYLRAL